jgi:hypothetical protein
MKLFEIEINSNSGNFSNEKIWIWGKIALDLESTLQGS